MFDHRARLRPNDLNLFSDIEKKTKNSDIAQYIPDTDTSDNDTCSNESMNYYNLNDMCSSKRCALLFIFALLKCVSFL